jgi:hypothetical protein
LSRRKSSKPILSILHQHFHRWNHAVAKDRTGTGLKIRPLDRLNSRRLRHNARHNAIALLEFNHFASLKPGEQLASVAELSDVYAEHGFNVTPFVSHCQLKSFSLIEKGLIRHFLYEGHNLLNVAGTHIAKHTISSEKITGKLHLHKILFE